MDVLDKEKVFLVLASLPDFSPKNRKRYFIGPDAQIDFVERGKKPPEHTDNVLPDPYKNIGGAKAAFEIVSETKEKMMEMFKLILNEYHGEVNSLRFWKIFFGSWPTHYLNKLYDHYLRVKSFLDKNIEFETYLVDPSSYYIPTDSQEFYELSRGPNYSLQMYSKIFHYLGHKFLTKPLKIKNESSSLNTNNGIIDEFIKNRLNSSFFRNPFAKIFLYRPPWSAWYSLKFFWKTKGEIGLGLNDSKRLELKIKDRNTTREKLKEKIHFTNEFELMAANFMIDDLPLSYLEGLRSLRNLSKEVNTYAPENILSSTSLYFDDVFKYWVSQKVEKGSALYWVQEDATQILFRNNFQREEILQIADSYWSSSPLFEAHYGHKVVFMPHAPLIGQRPINTNENLKKILIVSVHGNHFANIYPKTCFLQEMALARQDKLLETFPEKYFLQMQVRICGEDLAKENRRRILRARSMIFFDQIPDYLQSIKDSRIVIFSELTSMSLETLHFNRPIFFCWPKDTYELLPQVSAIFEKLHEIGIWHYSHESLYQHLESHYDEIHVWWADKSRHQQLAKILEQICSYGPEAFTIWTQKLCSIKKKKVR